MRRQAWMLMAVLPTLSACSDSPTEPSRPATLASVEIVGAPTLLPVGQSVQLRAFAGWSDGTVSECTSTARWRSSEPSYATVSAEGAVFARRTGNPVISGFCNNVEGTVRLTILAPISKVYISTDFSWEPMRVGSTMQLTLNIERTDISFGLCSGPATWQSSNEGVASVSGGGLLTARGRGVATVSGSCDGETTTRDFRVVEGPTVSGFLVDADVRIALNRGEVEVLDGPMAGQRFGAGLGGFRIHDSTLPVRLRVSSPDYDAQELVVTEGSGVSYPNFNTIEVSPQMRLTPLAGAQDVVGEAVNDGRPDGGARHTFRVRRAGILRVRTWWSLDYNDSLTFELRCGSRVIGTAGQHEGSYGQGFELAVEPCDVDLVVRPSRGSVRYRLRAIYPS
jgi:hypothetical protein